MNDLSKELKDRIERERVAHEEDDVLQENLRIKSKFPHTWSFPSRQRLHTYMDDVVKSSKGLRVLDFGCGRGEASLKYLSYGCRVTGIDISAPYIKDAAVRAKRAGFADESFDFHVMDAHAMTFENGTFDLVVGYGILHHLDPDIALAEIHRVLKPGGRVMLLEPLANNPLLWLFRALTPKARSVDEAPFTGKDVKRLSSKNMWNTELIYCGIFSLPVSMLTSKLIPSKPDNWFIRVSDRLERMAHRHHWLDSWNQYIVFNMKKKN